MKEDRALRARAAAHGRRRKEGAQDTNVAAALLSLIQKDNDTANGVASRLCDFCCSSLPDLHVQLENTGSMHPSRLVCLLSPTKSPTSTEKQPGERPFHKAEETHARPSASQSIGISLTRNKRPNQPRSVEALMICETMYLKDPDTMMVYSTARDVNGDLVAVGCWNGLSVDWYEDVAVQEMQACQEASPSPARPDLGGTARRWTLQSLNFAVTDPADHCETCVESYQDINDVLLRVCKELGKTPDALKIYDPYFCTGVGNTKRVLSSMGYKNVYNENEDFYKIVSSNTVPDYDILVTNPPFSGDHVKKLVEFAETSGLPWALLMPAYVAQKDFYMRMVTRSKYKPLYIVPKKRYVFYTPKGVNRGNKRFNKRGRTSPYVTIWYDAFTKYMERLKGAFQLLLHRSASLHNNTFRDELCCIQCRYVQGVGLNSSLVAGHTGSEGNHMANVSLYCNAQSLPEDIF